ncbi:sensor histidine kinase [Nonomuraea endophytica]|uniref:histidine kinase n=1 Tax=Nonomuraea endophytica TaxID=714136 RepID=A0A7W8A1V9_9ACTN|nr:histidine kinase [Nonomuraea endophytica]MBB5077330.1 signal transduction histidine kinase [Nonomuraea endophytica]
MTTLRQLFAAHPRAADTLFACAVTLLGVLLRLSQGLPGDPATAATLLALILAQGLPLVWRRTHPWPVMVVVGLAYVVYELADPVVGYNDGVFVAFAGYAVARYARPPGSAAVIVVTAAAVLGPEVLRPLLGRPAPPGLSLGPLEWVLVAGLAWGLWLLGGAQRRVQEDARRLRELTDRLRAEQELSARRAVTAERARIARDLHDLVAHHVSAIAMQARASAEALPGDPGVRAIGSAADTALEEMRRLLGLLADGGPGDTGPSASLDHLDRLAAAAESAGCRVELTFTGQDAAAVPQAAQVSAYRIVQEAFTNVLKHAGPVAVRVDVRQAPGGLSVVVANGPPAPGHSPLPGSGLGLIGMRERAALFDGDLRAGPHDGGWRVEARLRWAATG